MASYVLVTAVDDNSFVVIDVTDPSAPFEAAFLSGAGAPNYMGEPYGLAISDDRKHAYVVSGIGVDPRLVTINIENPLVPVVVDTIELSLLPTPQNLPFSVDLHNFKLVVLNSDGPFAPDLGSLGMFSLGLTGFPTFQSQVVTGDPPFLSYATGIKVDTNIVYCYNNNDGCLVSVDILDIAAPVVLDNFFHVDLFTFIGGTLQLFGNYLIIHNGPQLIVLDVSDPSNISHVSTTPFPVMGAFPGARSSLQGNYLYVTCLEDALSKNGLAIFDLSTLPAAPVLVSYTHESMPGFSSLYIAQGVIAHGSFVSVISRTGAGGGTVTCINVFDPANPVLAGTYSAAGSHINNPINIVYLPESAPPVVLPTVQTLPATGVI